MLNYPLGIIDGRYTFYNDGHVCHIRELEVVNPGDVCGVGIGWACTPVGGSPAVAITRRVNGEGDCLSSTGLDTSWVALKSCVVPASIVEVLEVNLAIGGRFTRLGYFLTDRFVLAVMNRQFPCFR